MGELEISSTPFLPWHYVELSGRVYTPGSLSPVKKPTLPFETEAEGVRSFWRKEKFHAYYENRATVVYS
jgi:hypothetical protein